MAAAAGIVELKELSLECREAVQIDVKYTLTGEGGGFPLFSPMSKIYDECVPYYLAHHDGQAGDWDL